MEAFYGLAKRLAEALGEAGLDYMFTGALAASFYGVPRTTTDVDVVVEVADGGVKEKLAEALRTAGLVVEGKEIDKALRSGYRIATFKDSKTAYRVDIILSDRKLKKRAGTVAGLATFYQAPEDLVLAKLRMIKATVPKERVAKDEEDIRAILRFANVNIEEVKRVAEKNSMLSIFEALIRSE